MIGREHPVDGFVRRLPLPSDEQASLWRVSEAKQALFEEITAMPLTTTALPTPETHKPSRSPRSSAKLAGAAVAALAAVLLAVTEISSPAPVAAGIEITRSGGDYVIEVVEPEREARELTQALEAAGLDIELTTVPVSPSLVGTIVMIGGSATGIEALQSGPCMTGGGGCPIGLRVPVDFAGRAEVSIGRRATAGEDYVSHASVWAPGEVLACTDLYGETVREGEAVLARHGLKPEYRDEPTSGSFDDWYITDVLPRNSSRVIVFVSEDRPPGRPSSYEAQLFAAC